MELQSKKVNQSSGVLWQGMSVLGLVEKQCHTKQGHNREQVDMELKVEGDLLGTVGTGTFPREPAGLLMMRGSW